ncbi:MAG TPA: hypothetical protein VGD83_14030, partial [Streptosporangiaceae bacterium]
MVGLAVLDLTWARCHQSTQQPDLQGGKQPVRPERQPWRQRHLQSAGRHHDHGLRNPAVRYGRLETRAQPRCFTRWMSS